MQLKPWQRNTAIVVGALLALYLCYMVFARWSNGHTTNVYLEAGTNPNDSGMFYRCVAANSSAGVCDPADPKHVTVGSRDRVHWTVRNLDLGVHTHDFKLEGWQYMAPYPWVETELEAQTESFWFTAWAGGDFRFICELPGHEGLGMWGTLTVT